MNSTHDYYDAELPHGGVVEDEEGVPLVHKYESLMNAEELVRTERRSSPAI